MSTAEADGEMKKTVFGYMAPDAAALAAAAAAHNQQPAAAEDDAPTSELAQGKLAQAETLRDLSNANDDLIDGRYRLGDAIERLAIGIRYLAQDTQSNRAVDITIVDSACFASSTEMERARRELRQIQKLEGAGILRVLDHGKHGDGLFVVHACEQAEPLARSLSDVGAERAQAIIAKVGNALSEAQKVGVLHRDISPANVLLCEDGSVLLRGFGIAPPAAEGVFGTPEYISPEQAAGRPIDQRSTIYSLGALLYHLIAGRPPFAGEAAALLQAHQTEEPSALPAGTSADVRQLIAKALEKNSSRRHLTLRQFLREVDGLGSDVGAARDRPISIETPLHGETTLGAPRQQVIVGDPAAVDDRSRTVMAEQSRPTRSPRGAEPSGATAAVTPESGAAVGGELSEGARIAFSQETPTISPRPATQPAPTGSAKPGFRETMWFVKGEVESAMAEQGEAQSAIVEAGEVDAEDLAEKYRDDGSLAGSEEARRLSLRTGKTQMMQAVKVPSGQVPGREMGDEEMLAEMAGGSRKVALIIAGVVVAALLTGIVIAVLKFT
ncbi:MAG: protein kinase [Deltaproteobacteria bacterium]|nr:protein kinase [Deltaproteobacteria bacterium]